jgi:integral membrane protein (TIGR01906 family)
MAQRRSTQTGRNRSGGGSGRTTGRSSTRARASGGSDGGSYGGRRRILTRSNILTALVGFVFLFCLSVVLTLNLRQIYYFDMRSQQLSQTTGLSEAVIRQNYDTLIDYNLLTKGVQTLEFPDFPMSEQGRTHFAEVKRIFSVIQIMCLITGILWIVLLFRKRKRRDWGSLKLTSILTLAIPLILGALAARNWNVFFVTFHRIFFRNNYWIFNPATDPVIDILPDVFFLHCVIAILVFLLLGCLLTALIYRRLTRRTR